MRAFRYPRHCESLGHHKQSELENLCDTLRELPEIEAKKAIQIAAKYSPVHQLQNKVEMDDLYAGPGDDCAAFKFADGYQLLAMEGMLPKFVDLDPRAAGWSSVMVNVSDIAAMGGRAHAIVNAFWDNSSDHAVELIHHIKRACDVFGIKFAGGHSSINEHYSPHLAVAIMGYAKNNLLSCYHLKPGQRLFLLTDLNGSWHGDLAYWGCVLGKTPEQIRAQWQVPAELAEQGLAVAAKDVSNGGLLGTLIMMLELTGCGATVDLNAIPRPDSDLLRWLKAFQSFGFLLAIEPENTSKLLHYFENSPLTCSPIGSINDTGTIQVDSSGVTAEFWNLNKQTLTALDKKHASSTF